MLQFSWLHVHSITRDKHYLASCLFSQLIRIFNLFATGLELDVFGESGKGILGMGWSSRHCIELLQESVLLTQVLSSLWAVAR